MVTNSQLYHTSITPARTWTSWIVSGLLIAFLITDAVPKIVGANFSIDATLDLGYPERMVAPIGIVLLISTILYAIPGTAFFGAIMLTGFLGGAVATQVRLEDLWFLFPASLIILTWIGLAMRNHKVRRLLTL